MVMIRLQRGGAKKRPYYRVVAIDGRRQRDGRALQFLGTYDPNHDPERIQLDAAGIQSWVDKGAQLSDTVRTLMKRSAAQPAAGSADAGAS